MGDEGVRNRLAATVFAFTASFLVLPAASAVFTDLTASAGVGPPGAQGWPYGHGAAWGDCDGDGDVDLFVPSNGTNALYRNLGSGSFAEITATSGVADPGGRGVGATWSDYDNDGDPDLYITNWVEMPGEAPNRLFRNEGDCRFTDMTAASGLGAAVWGSSSCWSDYDLDGWADVYVQDYMGIRPNFLYHNNGDGTFTDMTAPTGTPGFGYAFACIWFDYNEDGWPDLYTVNDRAELAEWSVLYRNNGDGTFTNVTATAGVANEKGTSMGVDVADYDNDGDWDVYVTNVAVPEWPNVLYRNNGDGTFVEVSTSAGVDCRFPTFNCVSWGVGWIDYDRDGWQDLFVANGGMYESTVQPNVLFHNEGAGDAGVRFLEVGSAQGVNDSGDGRGAAFADFDGDGDVDIYVANNEKDGRLYRNDNSPSNHWIGFRLQGTLSTREAIGAWVEIVSGSTTQRLLVKAGSSYASDNGRDLIFGLGASPAPVDAVVHWPTGLAQTLSALAADAMYTLLEPKPPAPSLTLPANNSEVPGGDVTFQWIPAPVNYSASAFELEVADNSAFLNATSYRPVASPFTLAGLNLGALYWRVRGLTSLGMAGEWSESWALTVTSAPPVVTSFTSSAPSVYRGSEVTFTLEVTDDLTPPAELSVSVEYDSGDGWIVEYMTAPTFANGAFIATFSPPPMAGVGIYRFRAIAVDGEGHASAPSFLDVAVLNRAPEAQSLAVDGFGTGTPGLAHILTSAPILSWTHVDAEGGSQVQYEARVGTGPGLDDVWSPGVRTGTETFVAHAGRPLVDGADYHFAVRVSDGLDWSPWTEVGFHTNAPPPAPSILSPADGTRDVPSDIVTLRWRAVKDADGDSVTYAWFLGTAPDLSSFTARGTTDATSVDVPVARGTTYYWLVRAEDGWEAGGNSPVFEFRTQESPSSPLGRVTVHVADDAARDLGGATVEVRDETGKLIVTGTTAPDGRFSATGVEYGTYVVTVSRPGFDEVSRTVVVTAWTPAPVVEIVLTAQVEPAPTFLGWPETIAAIALVAAVILVFLIRRKLRSRPGRRRA